MQKSKNQIFDDFNFCSSVGTSNDSILTPTEISLDNPLHASTRRVSNGEIQSPGEIEYLIYG